MKEGNLERFIDAQQRDYQIALKEIKAGRKQGHWMWYIFPQLQGLGNTETSKFYALADLNEADTYLSHPLLGSRLVEICNELLKLNKNDPNTIFGHPDDLKLKSSMTLFAEIPLTNPVFIQVLNKFYDGSKDDKTLNLLKNRQNI
ncbi:calpastatin [Pedobacter antarcticus 4BY]|uniref:Calpastatin n=2 Tax=Pedobacter antarcticus TaxID=34086 RepID=A0A081PHV9_9SPHI|nr:DUF1810 domain-containing protein [Pedobacter antarcticus]KEQ30282.1 calpastatin [Pedobacter antarcticus 4BY]SFE31757.1 Uncharacterized protein, DUF1810 family [Pedobacter antarcticus]